MLVAPVDTDIWVPVGPVIQADDFKTRKTGIVWNEAGLTCELIKESLVAEGTDTTLPITSGIWFERSKGKYEVKITAAQNNVEGSLHLELDCTDYLPFGSPHIQIVPLPVWTSFVTGATPFPGNQVVVGPIVGATNLLNFVPAPQTLAMHKKAKKIFVLTVLDANDAPVDLSGMTLRFRVETLAETSVSVFETSSITVSGANDEVANITVTDTDSDQTADEYRWILWDDDEPQSLMYGKFLLLNTSE
jgi:hypothetical protein